jgi:intracellular sulfur oxidation DsrE/DsrF family protein
MKTLHHALLACVLAAAAGWANAQDKVVYHISDAPSQALAGLRNVRNHLDTEPTTQITVVAHGQGVDFLMEGAQDKSGQAYDSLVAALKARGVRFEVCENTLKNRNLKKDQFIQEADFTPSGVVRVTKLQLQGWAYLKP